MQLVSVKYSNNGTLQYISVNYAKLRQTTAIYGKSW